MLYYRVYLHAPTGKISVIRHGEPFPYWVDKDTDWADYFSSCDGAAVEYGKELAQDRLDSFYGEKPTRYDIEWYCL